MMEDEPLTKLRAPAALRSEVTAMLRTPLVSTMGQYDVLLQSIIPDIVRYQTIDEELSRAGLEHTAAEFQDADGSPLPMLLVPDEADITRSRDDLIKILDRSNIPIECVTAEQGQSIFADRLAEFLAVRGNLPEQFDNTTKVTTNRAGDTVLYRKGFFFSTAAAFGVSNPAVNSIPGGRYTFGIMDSGGERFDGVVWDCPGSVRLELP